jgi:predicted DNA-binding protein
MESYKFRDKPKHLEDYLTQIEDKLATKEIVNKKADKVTDYEKAEPRLKDLKNGDERVVKLGNDWYLYKRIGSFMIRFSGTEIS